MFKTFQSQLRQNQKRFQIKPTKSSILKLANETHNIKQNRNKHLDKYQGLVKIQNLC